MATLLFCVLFISTVTCSRPPLSDIETVIDDLPVSNGAVMSRVVAHLESLIRENVRDATAELTSHLAAVSSRLDRLPEAAPRAAEDGTGVSEVILRLTAMEQSVTAMLNRQEGIIQTVAGTAKRQNDVRQTVLAIAEKIDGLQEIVSGVVQEHGVVRQALMVISKGQERLKQSISPLAKWQNSAQSNLTDISGKQDEVQKSLTAIARRQKLVQHDLSSMSGLPDDIQNRLIALSKNQEKLQYIISDIPTRLSRAQQTPSSCVMEDSIQQVLTSISKKQEDIEQSLSLISRNQNVQQPPYTVAEFQDGAQLAPDPISTGPMTVSGPLPVVPQLKDRASPTCDNLLALNTVPGKVLGQKCRGVDDCSSLRSDSVCNMLGRCECREGFQEVAGGFCRPHPRLSEPCRGSSDCRGGTKHAVCTEGVCSCPSHLLNFNNTECRPYPNLAEECLDDSECQVRNEEAVCTDNACACPFSLLNFDNTECRPYPELSESCRANSECQVKSEPAICSDGVCACPSAFWNHNNTECRPGVGEGETCVYEEDCTTTFQGMHCEADACVVRACETPRTSSLRFRLYGGSACDNGYVQFTRDGGKTWVYACDTDWSDQEATAMCRDMGFRRGTPGGARRGVIRDRFRHWEYRRIDCSPFARSLLACNWRQKYRQSCPESDLPFVTCHAF